MKEVLAPLTKHAWVELEAGAKVVLVDRAGIRNAGIVDAVAPDGSIIWVLLSNGNERRLFLQSEISRWQRELP